MTTKHALMTMAAVLALLASPASAAEFAFTLSGSSLNASFVVDTAKLMPPVEFDADTFVVENIAGTFDGSQRTADSIIFNTLDFDGGLTIQLGGSFFGFLGPQLFSGTTAMPTLSEGTFALRNDVNGGAATLNVATAPAAVPEPASWAMMIAGFGLAGTALRRRAAARPAHA